MAMPPYSATALFRVLLSTGLGIFSAVENNDQQNTQLNESLLEQRWNLPKTRYRSLLWS